jgi:hypothetical protein
MGKRREPDIFDDNPLTEDFLEWMVSPDGQTAGEVSGLVFATLENASVDAKRRKVIWADGERLSIEQSAERIHAEHPDRPRELIEISLCSWFEHRVPESGSERQINELDRLFGPWIRDRERKARAAKNDREVRTLKDHESALKFRLMVHRMSATTETGRYVHLTNIHNACQTRHTRPHE